MSKVDFAVTIHFAFGVWLTSLKVLDTELLRFARLTGVCRVAICESGDAGETDGESGADGADVAPPLADDVGVFGALLDRIGDSDSTTDEQNITQ